MTASDKHDRVAVAEDDGMQAAIGSIPPQRRDAVVDAVRADLLRRSQVGIAKYGTTLAENPAALKERLQHIYEECLDAANYLKWAMMDLEDRGL